MFHVLLLRMGCHGTSQFVMLICSHFVFICYVICPYFNIISFGNPRRSLCMRQVELITIIYWIKYLTYGHLDQCQLFVCLFVFVFSFLLLQICTCAYIFAVILRMSVALNFSRTVRIRALSCHVTTSSHRAPLSSRFCSFTDWVGVQF